MGELIRGVETPRVSDTNTPGSAAHREAHATGEYVEVNEADIAVTRQFILDKYHVPAENVTLYEYKERSKPQRKLRAFVLLTNKDDSAKNFYAEGNAAHLALNNMMLQKFSDKIGAKDFSQLFDEDYNIVEPWIYRKGFLDPFHNGFKNFPALREDLLDEVRDNKEINDLSEESVENISNGNGSLPNWFLSADTSRSPGQTIESAIAE